VIALTILDSRRSRCWTPPLAILEGCGLVCVLVTGCIPALPENTTAAPPERSFYSEAGDAAVWTEPGLEDALWIEIPRPGDSGIITGYLSQGEADTEALVILLHGASTGYAEGSIGATRAFHETRGRPYRDAGYRTLSLNFPECGTAYGHEDLDHLLELIDWLEAGGKEVLGVRRIYMLGYSVGATSALLANRRRQVAAIAAIGGVTEPEQLERSWALYYLLSQLYPDNEGLCHLGTTLAAYGLPGSAAWQRFDTVGHVHELKSPMLVIQGTEDQVYSIENARHLEAAYQQAVSSGIPLPLMEFLYVQGADHFAPVDDPGVARAVLAFFDRFRG